ncbi:MAG: hypothetical protein COB85_08635, partial [Bacteroidetes bacterium]
GDTTDTAFALVAGDYQLVTSDALGCGTTDSITITEPAVLTISFTDTVNASCFDSADGSATVTPVGGTIPYTYLWNDPGTQTDSVADGIKVGTYTVIVTDTNGCTVTDSVPITEPAQIFPNISIEANDSNICDAATVTFTIVDSTSGGATPSFQWQLNNVDLVGENGNTYVTGSLINGDLVRAIMTSNDPCALGVNDTSIAITINVTANVTPSVTIVEDVNNICAGDLVNFSISISSGGGTPTYQWQVNSVDDGGETTSTYATSLLLDGDQVRLIMTSSLECVTKVSDTSNAITINVTTNLTPSTSISSTASSICVGQSITFNVIDSTNGGTSPAFQWQLNGSNVAGQTANSYVTTTLADGDIVRVIMTTSLTCFTADKDTSNQITITVNPYPTATITDSTDATCFGGSDGTAVVSPAAGNPPYTFDWVPDPGGGDGNDTANGLSAGTYTVNVSDANGCTVSDNVIIGEAPSFTASITDTIHVSINGGNDGQAIVTPVGGTGPYLYLWSPSGGTDSTGTALSAGLYNVTVTDNNGCEATASVVIEEPGNLDGGTITVNGVSAASICSYNFPPPFLDSISPSGGTSPYIYLWEYSTDFLTWDSFPSSDTIEYNMGVLITKSTFIRRLVIDAASDSSFSNFLFLEYVDSISLSILGLLSDYCLEDASASITGVPTDSGGVFTGPGITDNLDGTGIFNPSTAGVGIHSITYTYTDSKGCVSVVSVAVTVNAMPTPNYTAQSQYNVLDPPQTITGIPSGGTFSGTGITDPTGIFDPGNAGVGSWPITYTYTDGNGCTADTTKTIIVATATGSIDSINAGNIYCVDEGSSILYGNPGLDGVSGAGLIQGLGVAIIGADTSAYYPDSAYFYGIKIPHTVGNYVVDSVYFSYQDSISNVYTILEELYIYNIAPGISFTGNNGAYCIDYGLDTLFGIPQDANGSFTGSGVTDNGDGTAIFDPATAGVGITEIYYAYVDSVSSCSYTDSLPVTVNPLPVVSFTSAALYNVNDPNQTLTGVPVVGSPPTLPFGNFTDSLPNFINNLGVFLPADYGVGNHLITYSYTDINGCIDDSSRYIIIQDATGSIDSINTNNIYCIDEVLSVMYGNVSDGVSGAGFIKGNGIVTLGLDSAVYDANVAGGGPGTVVNDTIVFSYLGSDAFTVFTITEIVTIYNLGSASIIGLDLINGYCTDADSVLGLAGTPLGGIFTGPGITGFDFIPPNATVGQNPITYTYIDTVSLCMIDTVDTVTIHPLPTPAFTPSALYNVADGLQTIPGIPAVGSFPTLPYGEFSDTANPQIISTTGTFLPADFGLGTFEITYTYTDINGCVNSFADSITILDATGSIDSLNAGNIYCVDEGTSMLYGNVSTGYSSAGFIAGNGIVTFGTDSSIYDPTLAAGGPGTAVVDTILFQYLGADSITIFTISEFVTVYNLGLATISGLDPEYCEDADTALLFGTPITGVFTGSGITVNDFVPPDAFLGTDSITYTYTDPISACVIDTTVTTIVHPLPVVTFVSYQADSQYCDNDPLDTLIGVPLGGTFSSSGIVIPAISTPDSVVLNALASPTGTGIVTYTFTDSNTCINSFTIPITIDTIPSLAISSLDPDYCIDAPSDVVNGIVGSSFGLGGFSGPGIIDIDTTDGTALFEPDSASVGNGTIVTFYFTDGNGCSNFIEQTTDVIALPILSIVGLDSSYCQADPTTQILGSPAGGTFAGGGITNSSSGIYIPDVAGVGLDTVIYTYTDIYGCVNSDSAYSMINSNPTPSFTISSNCIADSIQFFDNSTLDPSSVDSVVSWSWDFGDPFSGLANTSTLENPKHLYNGEGLKSIDLEVTTNEGCIGTLSSQTINLGTNPTANFTWTDECFGLDSVHFNNISISDSLTDSVTFVWNFGDGDTLGQTLTNPAHNYDSILSYSVSLTLNTSFSCFHTVTKTLTIRPNIDSYPYFQDFENGHGGWVADAADTVVGYSWELGTPNNTIINAAYSGTNAWVTDLDTTYLNGENSWVLGPCFDF